MSARSTLRLGAGLVLGAILTLAAGGVSAADDGPEDFPLEAQVTTTPAGSGGGAGSTGGPSRSSSDDGSAAEVVDPAPTPVASPEPGLETSDGILAVGGLRTSYTPSSNPLDGTMHVEVRVQNLSTEVIAPTIAYSLTNVLGRQVSEEHERTLGDIAPGELRTSRVDLTGVGQWAVLGLHMTLTPPESVDGVELGPVVRDRWQLVPPWYLVATLAFVLASVAIWRRATRVPARAVVVGAVT